jgi:integrase
MPLGTHGKVLYLPTPSGRIMARVKIRDWDGRVRMVSKTRSSRAAAERALKQELASRRAPGGAAAITSGTRMTVLADAWLAADHGWSTGTFATYRSVVKTQVKPAFGQLCLREVTPGAIGRALTAVAKNSGPGAAKMTRSCLSGMFALAVADGAVTVNPVRDAPARLNTTPKKAPHALTRDEADRLVELFRTSTHAVVLDLPDLVEWMLATGCRIGEALAVRYGVNGDGRPLLDLEAGTWEVNATVVRVAGQGLVVQPRPKTAAGWRVIALPHSAVRMLERRRATDDGFAGDIVFATPLARGLRDPVNVSGHLRELLDGFECDRCAGTGYQPGVAAGSRERVRCTAGPWSWVTSHTFRKTVATRLDEAGLSPRQVADQLGHANPSMTLDVYFGRHVVSAEAARALDRPQ